MCHLFEEEPKLSQTRQLTNSEERERENKRGVRGEGRVNFVSFPNIAVLPYDLTDLAVHPPGSFSSNHRWARDMEDGSLCFHGVVSSCGQGNTRGQAQHFKKNALQAGRELRPSGAVSTSLAHYLARGSLGACRVYPMEDRRVVFSRVM